MSDDYESRREQRRQEEREYQSDVWYNVWRSGGNPDRVNPDRVQDAYWRGEDIDSASRREIHSQRPKPQFYEEENCEQFPPEEPPVETENAP